MSQESSSTQLVPMSTAGGGLPALMESGMAGPAVRRENPLVTLHHLLRGRYLWAILLSLVLGPVLGYAGFRHSKPEYRSSGQIQLKANLSSLTHEGVQQLSNFEAFAQTQMIRLKSSRAIDLAMDSPEWKLLGRPRTDAEVARFTGSIDVTRTGTEWIEVGYRSPSPEVAWHSVNVLLQAYDDLYKEGEEANVTGSLGVLKDTRTKLLSKLADKQAKERELAKANEFGADSLRAIHDARMQAIMQLQGQLDRVQMSIAEKQGQTSDATAPTATSPALPKPAVTLEGLVAAGDAQARDLLQRRNYLRQQMADALTRWGENNVNVRNLRVPLASAEQESEAYVAEHEKLGIGNGVAAPGTLSLAELKAQEKNLEERYTRMTSEANKLGRAVIELETVQGEIRSTEDDIKEVNRQIDRIELESQASGRMSIFSRGEREYMPSKDSRIRNAGMGAVGGIMMSFGIFVLLGLIDRRVKNLDDAKTAFQAGQRILGILPTLPDDLADPEQASLAAYCVHQIRTLLEVAPIRTPQRIFAVTSSSAGEGKTSLTLALGLSFAASDSKTLLIDCDVVGGGLSARMNSIIRRKIGFILRREGLVNDEQLTRALQLSKERKCRIGEMLVELGYVTQADIEHALSVQKDSLVGLLDVLEGESLENCVTGTGTQGLSILPLGAARAHHSVQVSQRAIRRVLAEARQRYDVVLIDTGPVPGSIEAGAVAAAVDGVILTVVRGQSRSLVTRAIKQLESIGAPLLGIVFNRALNQDVEASEYSVSASMRSIRITPEESTPSPNSARLGPVARAVASSTSDPDGGKR